MKRWILPCVFVAAFLSALAVAAPMSLALSWLGADEFSVSAANVSGTIWSGQLKDAHYRETPLGDVDVSLDPLSLIGGTRRLAVTGSLGKLTLVEGAVNGLEAADIAIAVEHLGIAPSLNLRLENATVLFSRERCSRAEGRIAANIEQFGGLDVSGTLACAGEAAIARLQGGTETIEVSVTLRVNARAQYEAQTRVASSDPIVRAALAIAGFVEQGNEFVRSDEGVLGL
jgi:general secretion pathway protein N